MKPLIPRKKFHSRLHAGKIHSLTVKSFPVSFAMLQINHRLFFYPSDTTETCHGRQKEGAVSLRNHFVNLHRKNQNCHCEPVTDVTGVAIPPTFWMHFGKHSHSTGGFPRQCAHWLGMTVLLFVQLYFNETAPFAHYK